MNLSCNSKELCAAVTIAANVSNSVRVGDKIGWITLIADKDNGELNVYATGGETILKKSITATIFEEGSVSVEAKTMGDYVKKLTEFEEIEMKSTAKGICLMFGRGKANIAGECGVQFYAPDIKPIACLEVKTSDLKKILGETLFCSAVNDTRETLKCCNLRTVKNGERTTLSASCLDGVRIGYSECETSDDAGDINVLVETKKISIITSAFGDDENIVIKDTDKMIVFDGEKTTIVLAKVAATPIDCIAFKNKVSEHNIVEIDTKRLKNALERAIILATGEAYSGTPCVTLEIVGDEIKINASREKFEMSEAIDCVRQYGEDDIKISFNGKFLIEALGHIDSAVCEVIIGTNRTPAIIRNAQNKDKWCLVLPVRTVE